VQASYVFSLGFAGVLTESGCLAYGFSQILGEVADVATGFLGAAEDAFDVHLRSESDHVCGFGELLACLFPGGQRFSAVWIGECFGAYVPDGEPLLAVNALIVVGPPHLVICRRGDRSQFCAGYRAPDCGMKVWRAASLRFDSAEILYVPADTAPGVLPEPIN
jgi:hypothetical protein